MRVAIDIRPALRRGTGVGTFVEQLVLALDAIDGDHCLRLFTSSFRDRWNDDRLGELRRGEVIDRRWPVAALHLLWNRLDWPPVERFVGAVDVAHSPTPLLLPSRGARVVTLHDLYFLRRPEHTHAEIRRDYAPLVRRHVAAADAVLAVSEATAADAVDLLDIPRERITVCGEDASPFFDLSPTDEELERGAALAREPFVLFVGTVEPRKNLPALVRAFGLLPTRLDELSLVVAGDRGWGAAAFDEALGELRRPERVRVTGYLDPPLLRALYHRASALVMPSHWEGFGLPLVEAMACGCPLLVADNSALPEVAGEAALYWRGGEPEELAALLGRLIDDEQMRSRLVEAGRRRRASFSWRTTAGLVLGVYRRLAAGHR